MTNEELKRLEVELWDTANTLHANCNLTPDEYKDLVLGLIFLRFSQNRFDRIKIQIEENLPETPRGKRKITKTDFVAKNAIYLVDEAKYDYLANLAEDEDTSTKINKAMELIEKENSDLSGILPKNYQDLEDHLLRELIRVFNKDAIKQATGDVFGRIYEYFLLKFSMNGGQKGGEFFTPPSLVQLIVNFIEPEHGIVHDPACGSSGMFLQTGHFIKEKTGKEINKAITIYGTEQKTSNANLAKMNLAIHGIEGKIIESNSFYSDPHNLVGKCDFVMANPPFNVKNVDKDKEFVKTDNRLPHGLPKNNNANYLWIQYFMSYLNNKGKAGFVMASSATDAGNSEKLIRQKLIESENVDVIVAVANNFFYTVSLPCHVWFFNKNKLPENKDKILMIDARNTFRKVSTTINDFSEGKNLNLTCLKKFFNKDKNVFDNALNKHSNMFVSAINKINHCYMNLKREIVKLDDEINLEMHEEEVKSNYDVKEAEAVLNRYITNIKVQYEFMEKLSIKIKETLNVYKKSKFNDKDLKEKIEDTIKNVNLTILAYKKYFRQTDSENHKLIPEAKQIITDWKEFHDFFPNGKYEDIEGLCKIVDIEEVKENDYSLTPGRYVGYSIKIDENFDYKSRMNEIHNELGELHNEANSLMKYILKEDF